MNTCGQIWIPFKMKKPSQQWRDEILVLRDLFDLNIPQAMDLLKYFGTAEEAFEALA